MNFDEYEKWAIEFFKERNWYQLDSSLRLNFLMEEVGELSQAVRRYEIGRDRPDEAKRSDSENLGLIKEELADVLDNVIILMDKYDISFEDMTRSHREKFEDRY
ncbi:MAG: MazG-like family protein [Peptostreptococcus sp.]|uniref:MazG-like family protein n=1 Tax=Peptostreptococcus sp. TaxID=1262 RepID=UPI002FC889E6